MKNILIIDQALEFGGSIVSTANLIRGIDQSEYNIVFFSSTSKELVQSKLRERASNTPIVIAKKIINYNNAEKHFWFRNVSSIKYVRQIIHAFIYSLRLIFNTPYMFKVWKTIRKYNIDLIQANNGVDDEVCLVGKLTGVKIVVYLRGYVPLGKIQRRYFLPGIQFFFTVSSFIRKIAEIDGIPSEKLIVATPPAIPEVVLPNKVEDLRRKYSLKERDICIGIFGRITEWKGQLEFLKAGKNVVRKLDNVKLFIIGDTTNSSDDYFNSLKQYVKSNSLEDYVIFTGYIDNVYDYYEMMDLVIHASIDAEPSGRVIFESMSQGTPTIASSLGGPKEFVDHEVDGYVVDPRDTELLSQKIEELVRNPMLRQEFGEKAKNKISTLYNKETYAEKIKKFYSLALQEN